MALKFLNDGYFAGKVGIGTASPSSILELAGTTPILTLSSTAVNVAQGIEWRNSGTLDAYIKQGPSTAEFEFNVGRNTTWGGDFKFVTDTYDAYRITRNQHKFFILGSAKMTIDGVGNVGIGTTSPTTKLHIEGDGSIIRLQNNNSDVNGTFIDFRDSTGTRTGYLGTTGASDDMFLFTQASKPIRFFTNATERARITGAGNVGIGTTSPGVPLEVNGVNTTSGQGEGLRVTRPGVSSQYISIDEADGSKHRIRAIGDKPFEIFSSSSSYGINFFTNSTQKATILANGNVGIGTTSPGLKLDINSGTANSALRVLSTDRYTGIKFEDVSNNDTLFYDGQSDLMYLGSTNFRAVDLHAAGNLRVEGAIYDSNNSPGTANQVLISTVTGTDWVDGSAIPGVPAGSGANKQVTYWTGTDTIDGDDSFKYELDAGNNALLDLSSTGGQQIRFFDTNSTYTESMRLLRFDDKLIMTYGDNANEEALTVVGTGSTAGNVGIGTTSPSNRLEIVGPYSSTPLKVLRHGDYGNVINLGRNGVSETANIGYPADATLNFSTSGTERMRILANGTILIGSTIDFSNGNADDLQIGNTTGSHGVSIMSQNNAVGSIYFGDNDNNDAGIINYEHSLNQLRFVTNRVQRMIIDSGGNVGIGTNSPAKRLHISASDQSASRIRISNTNTGSGGDNIDLIAGINNVGQDGFSIFNATSNQTQLVIQGAGNVGIGTTNPQTKLEVNGGLIKVVDSGDTAFYGGDYVRVFGTQSYGFRNSAGSAIAQISLTGNSYFNGGNVGIGTTSPFTKLHAEGVVTIKGSGTATSGSLAIQDSYGTTDHLGNIGWNRSAGGPYLAYGIKQDGSADWKSTFDNFSGMRSYMKLDNNEMQLAWAPAQQTTVDTVITGLLERFTFQLDSGTLKLNAYDGTNKTGTPTYLLGTDGSGNIVKTLPQGSGTAGPYLPLAGGTMTGDLLVNTTGGYFQVDVSDNSVKHADGTKAKFGTGSDLQISHDAFDSYINNFTGNLNIVNLADNKDIIFQSDNGSGGVTTYLTLDGSNERLQVDAPNGMLFTDSIIAKFGTSADLKIFHNATDSFIINEVGDLKITQGANDKDIIFECDNGSGGTTPYFQLDGSHTQSIAWKNIHFVDGIKAQFGDYASPDLEIYHDGSNSYIQDVGTGMLAIDTNGTDVRITKTDSEFMAKFITDAEVQLYYNGSKKFETTSTGVTVTGAATATTFLGDLNGTINTATTAVTQANAVDNETVATTAYVNNKIALIPAGLVFQGTWNAATNSPTLTSGSGTTGNFYIVSTPGNTNLDGITDWKTGDWAVFIEQGASDQWEKIDNSSVLDGFGTGGSVAGWAGSGTSNTLTDAPITFSGNNTTFAGNVTVSGGDITASNAITGVSGGSFRVKNNGGTTIATFNDALNATFAGTGTFAGNVTLAKAVGDTELLIEADTNNNNENYNPRLHLRQDGGAISAYFGLNGDAGNSFTGALANGAYIRAAGSIQFANGGGTDLAMTIDTSQNVGIGTTSPVGKLYVGPTWTQTGGNDLYIKSQSSTTSYDPSVNNTQDLGITYNTSSTTTTGPDKAGLVLHNDAGVAGEFSPMIIFSGREATPSQYKAAMAGIYARSPLGTGNGNSYIDGELIFATAGAATQGIVQRMVINKEGNVGIGTTSPGTINSVAFSGVGLHVKSGTLGRTITEGSSEASYLLNNSGASVNQRIKYIQSTAGNLAIGSFNDNGLARPQITVLNSGNVGIGTTSPGSKLVIAGGTDTAYNDGTLKVVGSIALNAANNLNPALNRWALRPRAAGVEGSFDIYDARNSLSRLTIVNSGNVGIGTTSPQSKLQVAGGIQMADDTATASAAKVGTMRYRTATDEPVPVTGTELVTNGNFTTDTAWSKGTGITISGGTANFTSVAGQYLNQDINFTNGAKYLLRFEITAETSGVLTVFLGAGNNVGNFSGVGQKEKVVTGSTSINDQIYFGNNFTGSIDNVSVIEVTEEDASYADMCMQTGSSTYEWVNIVRNTY